MPAWTYSDPGDRFYPESRDANGKLLGQVGQGDIRLFDDAPPDHRWTPANGGGDADRGQDEDGQGGGGDDEAVTSQDEGTGTPEGDAPDPSAPAEPSAF